MKSKELKRKEAKERQAKYDALSLDQKLKLATGARQRDRLLKKKTP